MSYVNQNRANQAIQQLQIPLACIDDDAIDYMIICSSIGAYRIVIWKQGYKCYYCFRNDFYRINHRYEWRLKIAIHRSTAIRRIIEGQWKVLGVGHFKTHIMRTSSTGSILVPENFRQYHETYYQMIKVRNFHNQMDRVFWEFPIQALCPSICNTLMKDWFQTIIHKRRMRRVMGELSFLPPHEEPTIFPGGIEYQRSFDAFVTSSTEATERQNAEREASQVEPPENDEVNEPGGASESS